MRSCRRSPTPTRSSIARKCSTRTRTGTKRTYWGRGRSSSSRTRPGSRSGANATRTTITRACRISTASGHLRPQAGIARRGDPQRPGRDRVPRFSAGGARRTGRRARRQDHGADQRLELRRHHHDQPQEKAVRRCPGAPRADPGDRPLGHRAGAVEDRDRQDGRRRRRSRARRSPPRRRNCRSSPATGRISRNRAPRRGGC